ncbi:MAG: transporter [Solirubrobacterales bacterium]|nr:transporter [Solirubrobacterales bacterium]
MLAALAAASLTYSMMQSLVIPALPAIQRALHARPTRRAGLLVTITQARRWGVPSAATLTGVVIAIAFLMLTFARDGRLEVCTASGMLGAGCGIAMAALATLVVSHVARGETGAAAGVNNVARTLGGAIGTQLAAALLTVGAVAGGTPAAHGYTLAFAVGLAAAALALALGPLLPGRLEDPTAAAAARTAEAAHLA